MAEHEGLRQEGEGLVARAKLLVARFRALGGVPELCDLAWKLCCENERLRAAVSAPSGCTEVSPGLYVAEKSTSVFGDVPPPPRQEELKRALRERIQALCKEGVGHLESENWHAPLNGPDPECVACDDIFGLANLLRECLSALPGDGAK